MATSNLNISLLPLRLTWGDISANQNELEKALVQLHPHTDLVILPETFSTGFPTLEDRDSLQSMADENNGKVIPKIKILAKKYNIALCGSCVMETDGNFYNRAFFIEPSGDEYYADKRHLFTMGNEHKIFSSGQHRMNVRYRGWNISMVICYDIRFPVWCRNVGNTYDLLIVVANWPASRINAWDCLLPARAIENQSYLAAVNCMGTDKHSIVYNGSSHIIDFKGNEIGVRVGSFIYGSLSYDKLMSFRNKFPAWKDADTFILE